LDEVIMNRLPDSLYLHRQAPWTVRLLVFFFVTLIPFLSIKAENMIYVDIARSGSTTPVDTLFSGGSYDFRFWIENDARLASLRITERNWISLVGDPGADPSRGIYFTWENVGGYGPSGLNTGKACVTVESGSRMYPPNTVWDYGTGFRVWEHNVNEVSPDTIGFGGNAAANGLQPGPLQHMVSIHFKVSLPTLTNSYMHIDSAYIAPGGGIVMVDFSGNFLHPQFIVDGPWVIKAVCGDANSDGATDVADVVFLIKFVFKKGTAPKPLAVGNVNGDENVDVGDIVYLINYIFKFGPDLECYDI